MVIHYVIVTVLFIAGTAFASFLIHREQRKSRIDREKLDRLNATLERQTFPAIKAAGQAVEASQQLILSIQETLNRRT